MLRRGKIILSTLGTDAQRYTLDQSEPWVREVLVQSAPPKEVVGLNPEQWADASKLAIDIELAKLPGGEDYSFRGTVKADVPTICATCADVMNVAREGEFQLYIKLVDRFRGGESEDSGDADLIFVDHPEVDLRDMVSEQLIVLEPFAETPSEDSSGNTHICSKIPQIQARQDPESEAVSPFSKLAVLKGDN